MFDNVHQRKWMSNFIQIIASDNSDNSHDQFEGSTIHASFANIDKDKEFMNLLR